MSTTTLGIREYLEVLQRSELVDARELQALIDEYQSDRKSNGLELSTDSLAEFLINRKKITQWHQSKLIRKKFKGFFLGKYKFLNHLGSGGMGTVYLAEHTLMGRKVAIKVFPKQNNENKSLLARFFQEAQVIAALNHPNIVQAYNIDAEKDIHYLVMEYVDGNDLEAIVKSNGVLSPENAANYIAQAADALAYVEEVGIIHRDIKPANLLLDNEGVIKVLDMGLARLTADDENSLTRKHDENVIGTADYMPPEQAIDSHSVDCRADIYSLGGTLYFLLVGNAPFPDGTIAQRLMKHQVEQPQAIETIRDDVPKILIDACSKMMAKKPDDRFQSAAEIRDLFQNWLSGSPTEETITSSMDTLHDNHHYEDEDEWEEEQSWEEEEEPTSDLGGFAIQTEGTQSSYYSQQSNYIPKKSDPTTTYIVLGALGAVILIVLSWLLFSSPSEETQETIVAEELATENPFLFPMNITVESSDTRPVTTGVFNFNDVSIDSYAGSQDETGTATKQDNGSTLKLVGNNWKSINFPYKITKNTVLEFDFKSPRQGESHAIGFDNDNKHSAGTAFKLYGTQEDNQRNPGFENYLNAAGKWVHYKIPVGNFFQGDFDRIYFENDKDEGEANAVSLYSNLKVYESNSASATSTRSDDGLTLEATELTAADKIRFEKQPDGSYFVTGDNPATAEYTFNATCQASKVKGLKLEVLPDDRLKSKGPGRSDTGNFVLTSLTLEAELSTGRKVTLAFDYAEASFSQDMFHPSGIIDNDDKTGWGISKGTGKAQQAYLYFQRNVDVPANTKLTIKLNQSFGSKHTIGRFKLSLFTE
jgi:serine/threonine protein kinase